MKAALTRINDQLLAPVSEADAEAAGLREGDEVEVTVARTGVEVRRPRITLADIVAELKERGPPPPLEWEDWEPVGSEIW